MNTARPKSTLTIHTDRECDLLIDGVVSGQMEETSQSLKDDPVGLRFQYGFAGSLLFMYLQLILLTVETVLDLIAGGL